MVQHSFKDLARTFGRLEATASITSMVETLAEFLKRLSAEQARATAYLLQGGVAPPFKPIEFGMAERMVARSMAQAYGRSERQIERFLARSGDLGLVAEAYAEGQGAGFSINRIFDQLKAIAETVGAGSQRKKIEALARLLTAVSGIEAKYIVRTITGTQRIGVAEMTYLSALALARTRRRENKQVLEGAYNVLPDLGEISARLVSGGLAAINRIKPTPGVPIRMMLASRVQNLDEVPTHIKGAAFVEYKYDGERGQVHVDGAGVVRIFSRRLEDITAQYPEIVSEIGEQRVAGNTIFEGEIVAFDFQTQRLLPFQIVMHRKRTRHVEAYMEEVPVMLFVFDILLSRGTSLLAKSLAERRKVLEREINETRMIRRSEYMVAREIADIERYFGQALARGAEGVVIKSADSRYSAGKRGWSWIKFKKEYEKQLADTFDLAVVGALYGRGSRAGSYGSLLLAAFDPNTNKYFSLTKVGAGFTQATLAALPKILQPYRILEKHRLVETGVKADAWFVPAKVVEVSGANLTASPVHTVAKSRLKHGGLALRFPRFIRFRDDKSAQQATTVREIYDLYRYANRARARGGPFK
jgi:DNA ligase 1